MVVDFTVLAVVESLPIKNQIVIKFIIIIIIIIIKKGRQCKAEREWYTPYQSEDPSPTIPTYRQKGEKGKKVGDYSRDRAA